MGSEKKVDEGKIIKNRTFSSRSPKIDWDEAREYYVQDKDVSLRSVAKKYKVSLRTVAVWAKKQNWVVLRQESELKKTKDIEKAYGKETPEQTNKRHRRTYLEAQAFIRNNMALASNYMRDTYAAAKKNGTTIDKRDMYSAQNVKYMVEALKIALDGERVTLDLQTNSATKSQKEVKTANISAKLDSKQLEALFSVAGDAIKESGLDQNQQIIIDQDSDE